MMLPSGVVTFLFTDVVGSTRLWESDPAAMGPAMARHDELVETAVAEANGMLVRPRGEGDSRFAVFTSPRDAVSAAAALSALLRAERWPTVVPVQIRTAIHTGEADLRAGDYYGDAVNRCARLRSVAHAGQVLLSAATAAMAGASLPPGLRIVDLGEHRLKDLTRAEHVYQLSSAEVATEFPPLLSLDRATHNLPVQMSSFVGRDAELGELRDLLKSHRLVTITGFGGMGKTRLALQAAAELADGSGDGVWFVDLAPVSDSARVPGEIAALLSIRESGNGAAGDVLRAVADKNLLLVLDNVEQVLDCAYFIADLLAAAPAVHVLVTSREPLRLRGEQQFPVQPLPLPDPDDTPEVMASFDAVRLFVDRAAAVRPDFVVTAANASAVTAVCARLDGLPLALELAAARMKMLTIDSLLRRLQGGQQQLLTGGARDMPERHRTLRATIAWSVDALKPDERELLTAMSILPAPADFALIEALAGPDLDAFTLLDSLVEKSLVRTINAPAGETRYGLLVSIRDYAAENLTPDQRRGYQDRHADHLSRKLTELEARSYTTEGDHAHRLFVVQELDQLRAAFTHRRHSGPPAAEVTLVAGLDKVMVALGLYNEYLAIADHALPLAERPEHRISILRARIRAARTLDGAAMNEGRAILLDEGRRCSNPFSKCGAIVDAMSSARTLAELSSDRDEMSAALILLDDPTRAQYLTDERNNILASRLRLADPPQAEFAARALLTGDWGEGGRVHLAVLLLDAGREAEAAAVVEPLADTERYVAGGPVWQRYQLAVRADAARAIGDLETALSLAQAAFDKVIDGEFYSSEIAQVLAEVHRARGEFMEALSVLDRAAARMPGDLNYASAPIVWQRLVLLRRLGRAEPDLQALDHVMEVLSAAGPLFGVRDLLACAVERAVGVVAENPAYAARLLGWVDANRREWVLPFGMDDEIGPLRARLIPSYQSDHDAAARGDPLPDSD